MGAKTLLIALDGAEPKLIRKWADEGYLPNLKKALDKWQADDIEIPLGFGDGVFWATLYTGSNAGNHGHFFPKQFNPGSYELYDFDLDTNYGRDPFWQFCNKAGARIGIVDLAYAPLTIGINGMQVMDWMTHDRMSVPRSWPNALVGSLEEQYLADPINGTSESEGRTDEEFIEFHSNILKRVNAKAKATADLLDGNDWDLFCIGFADAHDVGHQSWFWHDSDNKFHPKDLVKIHGDPILNTYKALDDAVGEALKHAYAESVFIVSGIGMEEQASCNAVLQQVLAHYSGIKGADREVATKARMDMPYFELPHNMASGAVRINLIGREANGQVAPENYDTVCDELIGRLKLLKDAKTGKLMVDRVVKIKEHYSGKLINSLPDVMLIWRRDGDVATSVELEDGSVIEIENVFMPEMRAGDHSENAQLISSNKYQTNGPIKTETIAPTICRSLGINMPGTDEKALRLG